MQKYCQKHEKTHDRLKIFPKDTRLKIVLHSIQTIHKTQQYGNKQPN